MALKPTITRATPTSVGRLISRDYGDGERVGRGWSRRMRSERPHGRRAPVRIGAAFIAAAIALSALGLVAALAFVPEPGIDFEGPPGDVLWVLPGGPAWRAGVRAGHAVTEVTTGDNATDWRLMASDGSTERGIAIAGDTADLRGTVPLASLALLAALAAGAAAFRFPRSASAGASLAGMASSIPLLLGGHPVLSSLAGVLFVGLPLAWLGSLGVTVARTRLALGLIGSVLVVGWVASRFAQPAFYGAVDALRVSAGGVAAIVVIIVAVQPGRLWAALGSTPSLVAADLLLVGLAVGLALGVGIVGLAHPIVIGVVLAVAGIAYMRTRRPLVGAVDRAIFGQREMRASVAATETERGRVAREIHDEPLQELSAIIRRLEEAPGHDAEVDRLRDVAAQLRSLATDLRPPVLDDLGLGPAISQLAELANQESGAIHVIATLRDRTRRAERLPGDVEVALYRIVQEALNNAQRHSGGTFIQIAGELGNLAVTLTVADDGVGIGDGVAERAVLAGHLGLLSIRQRAAAVGAAARIEPRLDGGTLVTVTWPQ